MDTSALGPAATRPGRLGVGVIGVGKVGAALGNVLRAAGHQVIGVSAVSSESRERADLFLPGVPVLGIPEIVERAELVLFAVPDGALEELIAGLATLRAWQPGQLVAHTSTVHGLEILLPALRSGAIPMVITPVLTFTGLSLDVQRLTGATFAVTAPEQVLPIAQALAVEMGGEPLVLPQPRRDLFFAAVSHLSASVTTLVSQAERLLTQAEVERPDKVVGPLLRAAVEDAIESGDDALTGPAVRGDARALARDRATLTAYARASGSDHVLQTYLALARAAADVAASRGRLSAEDLTRLLDNLSQ